MQDSIKSFKTHPFRHTVACPCTCFFLEKPELSPVFVYLCSLELLWDRCDSPAPCRIYLLSFCNSISNLVSSAEQNWASQATLFNMRKTMYKFRNTIIRSCPDLTYRWQLTYRQEKRALNPVIPKTLPKFPQVMEFWELSRQVISGDVISTWECKNRI